MINPVVIFGAGQLGKMALDIFTSNGMVVFGFLDDNAALHQTEIGEISVLGLTEDEGILNLLGEKCDAFVAVEDTKERTYLVNLLKEKRKLVPVNAIHAESSVSPYSALGHGNLLAAGSRISAFAHIGDGCILQPNAVVETDAVVGSRVLIGSGSIIGSGAILEDGVFIGAGATILSGIKIGKNASIGAGSVVLENVSANARVFGYPAKSM